MNLSFSTILRLFRLQNLVMMALTMYLVRYMVILSILSITGIESALDNTSFSFIVASVILIAAAANLYNDLIDTETDLINKGEGIPALKISGRKLILLYYLMTATGIIAGSVATVMSGISIGPPIFIFCAGLLYYYSNVFKRSAVIGNIVVALLISITVAIPFIFDESARSSEPLIYLVGFYSSFAFFTTLSREIIKDCEDIEGDLSSGMRTLPIMIGNGMSRKLSGIINVLVLSAIIYIQVISEQWTSPIPFYYVLVFMNLPLAISVVRLIGLGSTRSRDRTDSHLMKFIMLTGVLSMAVFNYYL